ncbi:MAG: LacI family transcriptional regulator [Enterobacterales bacterium]|jgi:LacI family transcriptional regulator
MKTMKNITINEVAEMAGVSITTVSRVINAKPYVREKTRIKIAAAIKALNFIPDERARELAFQRLSA